MLYVYIIWGSVEYRFQQLEEVVYITYSDEDD